MSNEPTPSPSTSLLDWYSIAGNISADVLILLIRFCSLTLIGFIESAAKFIFGTPSIDTWQFKPYPPRYSTKSNVKYIQSGAVGYQDEIDVPATLKSSDFPLKPTELVQKCKHIITTDFGSLDESVLAADFRFVAPVVGPLGKREFLAAFSSFKLREALPDICENSWNFHVDPLEPNRVWWFNRAEGTHSAPLVFPPPKVLPPTHKKVEWPVSAQSMCFDAEGKCYQLTVGYSCDRQIGNTGGLGALFGLLYAVGKPLPFAEGQPWAPSPPFRLALRAANVAKKFGLGPGAANLKAGEDPVKPEIKLD